MTFGRAIGLAIMEHMHTQGSDTGMPDVAYSRYPGNSDRDWCSLDAANARLAELANEIRRADETARESFRVAMRNTLPHAKTVGDFLVEARSLCKLAKIPWEPWPSDNCDLSLRTAQAYVRIAENWEKVLEAQSSAPLTSIDTALKLLSQPKPNGKRGQPTTTGNSENHGEAATPSDPAPAPTGLLPAPEVPAPTGLLSAPEEPVPAGDDEPYDDSDECGEAATDIYHDLMKARRYFDALAIVIAQSEWSRFERDVLHLEATGLMRVLNETASALASQGGLHRSCALLITYPGDNDKHEVKDFLTRTVDAARPALEWGEIQKVVTAAKFKADGVKTELL